VTATNRESNHGATTPDHGTTDAIDARNVRVVSSRSATATTTP
jgi:hypothetical protein